MSMLSRFRRLALAPLVAVLAAGGLLLLLKGTEGPAAAGTGGLFRPAPTEFPPAGRDCFEAEVPHMMVDLGQGPATVILSGSSSVSRMTPYVDPRDGKQTIDTEMVALTLHGQSPELGGVTLTLQASPPSTGVIKEQNPGTGFPADSFFDVYVEIETSGGVYLNVVPVELLAVIDSIPPISATYQSQGPVPLQDPSGLPGTLEELVLHPVRERECWFWKAGGWEDYAPCGLPDLDQKQDAWGFGMPWQWTYCGPVAAADSLWWLDSELEPYPAPPTEESDHFPLVSAYGPWDDHSISNTVPLVDELARLFLTGPAGTDVGNMAQGLRDYLVMKGLDEDFTVTLEPQPAFDWVTEEVTRSEDVILLLGFWECWEWEEEECVLWMRLGGHYVTVAGVDPIGRYVALSDPFHDRAELGGPGRILSGTLLPHTPIPGHPPDVHNDAGNVSHDVYRATEPSTGHGEWGLLGYAESWEDVANFHGQNFPEPQPGPPGPYQGGKIAVEVEYAVATSPLPPKAWVIKTTEETDVGWNGVITYTITAGNEGGITGLDAQVVDGLPAGVTYLGSTPGGVHSGGVVTWTFPTLPPYSTSPLTVTAQVSAGLPIGGLLTNTVQLYLGTVLWDWDEVTSQVTGSQLFLPVLLRNAGGSRAAG